MGRRKKSNSWGWLAICIILGCGCVFFINKLNADRGDNNQMQPPIPTETTNNKPNHFPDLDMAKVGNNVTEEILNYTGFRLSFNKDNHTPNWVAWELLARETDGSTPRENKFWHDENVDGCAWHSDYKRSGYDRGHIIPAADQKWSDKAMTDCFVMCNICPQNHSLNSGAWNTLENKSRIWAMRDSAIVIIAGPIYENTDTERIGDTKVRVPSAFYKVIIAPYVDEPRGIGFVYPNMSSPGNMQNYVMTIDAIEEITGFDFFYNLPDSIENKIESASSFKDWNKR